MIEIFTEYHNHNKIIKKLYKNLRIISGQNIELEALILQIQSLERQIRKDDFHKSPALQSLIKVEVLDSYKSLSALAKDTKVHYLQFFQTFEEFKIGLKKYDNKIKLNQRLLKGLRLTKYIYENYLLNHVLLN